MYQEVTGGVLQRDYGVATVLYATAMGTYDGQAAHTQGGEEEQDGGEQQITAGDSRLYGLTDHTIANSSAQTPVCRRHRQAGRETVHGFACYAARLPRAREGRKRDRVDDQLNFS